MEKNYNLDQIKEMFEIVSKVRESIIGVYSAMDDYRINGKNERKKLKSLIPKYNKIVPKEIQEFLKINSKTLEDALK